MIRRFAYAALLLLLAMPMQVSAQAMPALGAAVSDSGVVADTLNTGVSPTGAFLRAMAIPGWGHASIGSPRRGAFYMGAQGGTAWMLLRIRSRLASANSKVDLRETALTAKLALAGIVDPLIVEDSLSADDGVADARSLVAARQQQREDWLAMGIFLVLLSGADAFVSAHLKDFPAEPEFGVNDQGRVDVGLRIQLGNH